MGWSRGGSSLVWKCERREEVQGPRERNAIGRKKIKEWYFFENLKIL